VVGRLRSVTQPGAEQHYAFDADGRLARAYLKAPQVLATGAVNDTYFEYDQRGKMLHSRNASNEKEEMTAAYSGLGHLVRQHRAASARSQFEMMVIQTSSVSFEYDALGNIRSTVEGTNTSTESGGPFNGVRGTSSGTFGGANTYQPLTGRLLGTRRNADFTRYRYDPAGNQIFEAAERGTNPVARTDRALFYGADGRLRTVEVRELGSPTDVKGTWEEYRYDALGRRVWTRTRRFCPEEWPDRKQECAFGTVQRTVWDGDEVLHEIRAAEADRENDGTPAAIATSSGDWDPHAELGHVMLTHGGSIDQPLSAIRFGYRPSGMSAAPAFAWLPLWDSRGRAPYALFGNGSRTSPAGAVGLSAYWLLAWSAYGPRNNAAVYRADGNQLLWMSSVMEDQQDASGLLYRRNRYYNPQAGRFTQEDPIGLAGGVNSYGFANGDPVGYSDPYGLKADSIIIIRSPEYTQRVSASMIDLARRSPTFRRIHNALASSSAANVYIRENGGFRARGCRGMQRNCTYQDGPANRIGIQLQPHPSDTDAELVYCFSAFRTNRLLVRVTPSPVITPLP